MAAFTGFQLPDITNNKLKDERERKQILDYLFQLTEQLQYVMTHLDGDNMTDAFKEEIKNGADTSAFERMIADTDGRMSTLSKQTAAGFEQVAQKTNELTISVEEARNSDEAIQQGLSDLEKATGEAIDAATVDRLSIRSDLETYQTQTAEGFEQVAKRTTTIETDIRELDEGLQEETNERQELTAQMESYQRQTAEEIRSVVTRTETVETTVAEAKAAADIANEAASDAKTAAESAGAIADDAKEQATATQTTLESYQSQTAAGFEQVVKKNDVISSINQSAEMVNIDARKIKLEGYVTINGTFSVDDDGYLRCIGGSIGGLDIGAGSLTGGALRIYSDGYIMVGDLQIRSDLRSVPELICPGEQLSVGAFGGVHIGGTETQVLHIYDDRVVSGITYCDKLYVGGVEVTGGGGMSQTGSAYTTGSNVNMRGYPDSGAPVTYKIPSAYSYVQLYGQGHYAYSGDGYTWYFCRYGSFVGWIRSDLLSIN